jgi:hypothetical protein
VTISQTWNDAAVAFTALKVNATSTNSAAGSLLLDLQVGGASQFNVDKSGTLRMRPLDPETKITYSAAGFLFYGSGSHSLFIGQDGTGAGNAVMSSIGFIGFANTSIAASGNSDTRLYRDSPSGNTLALRNGAAAQTFNVYGTYTSGTSYERLTLSAPSAANAIIGTNRGSGGGTARGLELQTDGLTRMTFGTTNNVVVKRFEVHDGTPFNDSSVAFSVDSSTATYLFNFYAGGSFRAAVARTSGSLGIVTTGKFGWQTTAAETSMRTALGENAAGVIEINNGTAGTFRDLRVRSVIQQPPASITPVSNGDYVVEATSNTTLTFKLKGTDGTVRTATLTLAP